MTRAVNPVLETDAEFYMSFADLKACFLHLYIVARGSSATSSLKFLPQVRSRGPRPAARGQGGSRRASCSLLPPPCAAPSPALQTRSPSPELPAAQRRRSATPLSAP